MSAQTPRFLLRTLLIFILAVVVSSEARPNHFGEVNQVVEEPESDNNLEPGLKSWIAFFEKLSDLQNNDDSRWARNLRLPQIKRQNRYRQCYFNPISCFRK